MDHNFFIILSAIYALSFLALWFYWRYLSYSALRKCRWLLGLAVVLHWGYAGSWFLAKHISLPTNSWESQLVVSAVIGTFAWILSFKKTYIVLDLFLVPVACLGMVIFHFFGQNEISELETSPWLWTHILFAVVGEALFFVSAITSAIYLFVETRLRQRHTGSFLSRYPSLPDFDLFLGELLFSGFICMSLGLFMGLFIANAHWIDGWYFDPKVILAVLTWIVYAIFLILRWRMPSFRGRPSAVYSILGALAVVFLSLGMERVLPTRHLFNPFEIQEQQGP